MPAVGERLMTILSFIRPEDRVLDIGTDHALLPVYLMENGLAADVKASDILEGPLQKARATLAEHDLGDRIELRMCDGLSGFQARDGDTVVIAGMGGETIADIISRAGWLKDASKKLILQPMTKNGVLRDWLRKNGFEICGEKIAREGKRFYTVICCRYTGKAEKADDLFGREVDPSAAKSDHYVPYLKHLLSRAEKVFRGRQNGKEEQPETTDLKKLIEKIRQEIEKWEK